MKKFLLSLAAVVLCASAAFADAVITVKDMTVFQGGTATMEVPETFTQGDFTFKVLKNNGSTAPAYNKAGDMRLYSLNTIQISAPEAMTKIVFTISAQGKKRLTDVSASTGTIATQASGDEYVTWTGNSNNVTFTVSENKAVYGTENTKAGQLDFTVIDITGGGSGEGGEVPPTPVEDPNYFKATSVESGSAYVFVASDKYNVAFDRNYGYMSVVNVPAGATATSFYGDATAAMTFTAVEGGYNITTTAGKILGAKAGYNTFDTTDDSAENRVWTVSFAADGTATIVNVATGKTIAQDTQFGSFGCYDADALEGKVLPAMFKLDGGTTPPPTPTTAVFEVANSISSGADYVMVIDSKMGQMINASYSYGRLNLTDVTIADGKLTADVNHAITITASGNGYTLKDSQGRYLGFDGEHTTSFQCYTEVTALCVWDIQFTNGEALMTLTAEGVTGTIGVTRDANTGNWFTNIAPSVGADEIKLPTLYVKNGSTAVDNIAVDNENAPVEFYNLQGVRVANPENGLYIRRQGNNVSKVYVR